MAFSFFGLRENVGSGAHAKYVGETRRHLGPPPYRTGLYLNLPSCSRRNGAKQTRVNLIFPSPSRLLPYQMLPRAQVWGVLPSHLEHCLLPLLPLMRPKPCALR